MLSGFLDRAGTLFDRRFLLAWWFPLLISISVWLLIYSWPKDWGPLKLYFSALSQSASYSSQLLIVFGMLLLTLVLAHMLQAFSRPLVQFWEGYWPQSFWKWYMRNAKVDKRWNQLRNERRKAISSDPNLYASRHEQLFFGYPSQEDHLCPTQLGNILRAVEDYAQATYGMNIGFWWPRLWMILPEAVQRQIDDTETPMIALLNFATQIGIVTLIGSIYLGLQFLKSWSPWKAFPIFIVFFVGLALVFIAYRSAASHAKVYGTLIRSAIDLYRFDLLKALHQALPSNLNKEEKLWDDLIRWLYLNEQGNVPSYAHNDSKP